MSNEDIFRRVGRCEKCERVRLRKWTPPVSRPNFGATGRSSRALVQNIRVSYRGYLASLRDTRGTRQLTNVRENLMKQHYPGQPAFGFRAQRDAKRFQA